MFKKRSRPQPTTRKVFTEDDETTANAEESQEQKEEEKLESVAAHLLAT